MGAVAPPLLAFPGPPFPTLVSLCLPGRLRGGCFREARRREAELSGKTKGPRMRKSGDSRSGTHRVAKAGKGGQGVAAGARRGHLNAPRPPAGGPWSAAGLAVTLSGFHARPFPCTPHSCLSRPLVITSCVDSRTAPSRTVAPSILLVPPKRRPGFVTRSTVTLTHTAQATAPARPWWHPPTTVPPAGSLCPRRARVCPSPGKRCPQIHQASPWPSFATLTRCSSPLQPTPHTPLQLNDGLSSAFSGR